MITWRDGLRTSRGLSCRSGVAAESRKPMQRIWDKWGLWVLFVVIGVVILHGLYRGATSRPAEEPSKPGVAVGK